MFKSSIIGLRLYTCTFTTTFLGCIVALRESGDEFKKGATKVYEKKRCEHYKVHTLYSA